MSIETLFFTQVASIVGFIVALFVLYSLLVSQKDAVIALLREKNTQLTEQIAESSPDVLVARLSEREQRLTEELTRLMQEKDADSGQIQALKAQIETTQIDVSKLESKIERAHVSVQRARKTRKEIQALKDIYDSKCQICNVGAREGADNIAQIAHILPFQDLPEGEDGLSNLLLLCPNHHDLFDRGAFAVNDDLTLLGIEGKLRVLPEHNLDMKNLSEHREHIFRK